MRKSLRFAVAVVCVLAFAAASHARVFMRWGRPETDIAQALDGKVAYKAALNVNGVPGAMSVVRFNDGLRRVMSRLRDLCRARGAPHKFASGDGFSFGTAEMGGGTVKLVGASFGDSSRSTVFWMEQSGKERASPLENSLLRQVPSYPGSVPAFSAMNEDTGAILQVSKTHSAPGDVASFFDSNMKSGGWLPALGTGADEIFSSGSARMYLKDRMICCVMARNASTPGETLITLLLKTRRDR